MSFVSCDCRIELGEADEHPEAQLVKKKNLKAGLLCTADRTFQCIDMPGVKRCVCCAERLRNGQPKISLRLTILSLKEELLLSSPNGLRTMQNTALLGTEGQAVGIALRSDTEVTQTSAKSH